MAKSTTGKKSKPRSSSSKATRSRAASRKKSPAKTKKTAKARAAKGSKAKPRAKSKAQTRAKTTVKTKTKVKSTAKAGTAAAPAKPSRRKSPALTIKSPSRKKPAKAASQSPSGAAPASKTPRTKAEIAEALKKKGRSVAEVASTETADAKGYVFINGRRVRMISTKGMPVAKRTRPNGVTENSETIDSAAIKSIKTQLSRKELNHYRQQLLIKRHELIGDLDAMETQALRSGGGNLSHMPIHMADIGSDTYDQDFMLGLAETERKQLREIDEALQRIQDRTYGVCQHSGQPIPTARLDAKPWAKYTVEAARKLESQWGG